MRNGISEVMENKHSAAPATRARLWLLVSLLLIIGFQLLGRPIGAHDPVATPAPGQPIDWRVAKVATLVGAEEVEIPPKGHPKLGSSLNHLLDVYNRRGVAAAQAYAATRFMVLDWDRVQVVVVTTPDAIGDLKEAIEALGGEYQGDYDQLLQAMVPIDALESVAGRPDVQLVREPRRPMPDAPLDVQVYISEGVAASNASSWHAAGYDGTGVRVAVIDGGFTDYADLLGTDLPSSVNTYDWTGAGMGGSLHGTACAELVHDMAPGAAMDLHRVNTEVGVGYAVSQAVADGVDIISTSLGWMLDGPGDGTGYLADIVADARSNGILFAKSAGNRADMSWSGTYNDSGDDNHLWASGQNVNYFGPGNGDAWVIPAGTPIAVSLHWDDWSAVDQDYDLVLLRWDGSDWVVEEVSTQYQDGGAGQTPEEEIVIDAPVETVYGVLVARYSSSRDVCLRLLASVELDEQVPARSLTFPGDSPDAVTVGAVDVSSPYSLEPYSSQGPTFGPGGACSGGATKPDLAGYANVSTVSYGVEGFAGTSAAAPHVAGAAALVKDAYPSYSATQLQDFLEATAKDLGVPGKDNSYGSGRLHLGPVTPSNNPPYTPSNPTPADGASGVPVTAQLSWTGGDPDPGDTVTYDVYFEASDSTPEDLICDDVSTPVCDPGTLVDGTQYYWYVVATDDHAASTTGDTWDFACGTANDPPTISDLPDVTVPVNGSADNAIDLWAYADDVQSADSELTFTIDNTPDPNAGISIDSNRYIDIDPVPDWTGETDVILSVTDPGGLSDTDSFQVIVSSIAFAKHTITGDFDGARCVYATDLDGDGDMDVLGAASDGDTVAWWENDGNENFAEHAIDSDFDDASSVYTTDVDGDGDMDILGAAQFAGDVVWWENDGDEHFAKHTIDADFLGAFSVYATDLDGDGDQDVLGAARTDGEITWWENDGSQSFTEHTIADDFAWTSSVYATDVDGDGDVDVLGAAYWDDEITWWENDGDESFTEHTLDSDFSGASSVYATDVDGDGSVDVLGSAENASDIAWWENDGSELFAKHTIDGSFTVAESVYAIDVDGDGDVDVVGAAWNAGMAWWENDGDEDFDKHPVAEDFISARSVYATDVDGDGDVDILGAAEFADEIAWWEQGGTPKKALIYLPLVLRNGLP